jgi:NitT/TauT family transport system substrate-binding protein
VVGYFYDPKTRADAIKIMAARVGVTPAEYQSFVDGTKLLKLDEAKKAFAKGEGFASIYGSSKISDDFNVANEVYKEHQDVNSYIDPSLTAKM